MKPSACAHGSGKAVERSARSCCSKPDQRRNGTGVDPLSPIDNTQPLRRRTLPTTSPTLRADVMLRCDISAPPTYPARSNNRATIERRAAPV